MLDDRALLAQKIRDAVAAIPRSKSAIADALGVTPQALYGWEKTGKITKDSLAGLAALAGLPLEHFVGGVSASDTDWADITGYAQAVGLGAGVEAQEYAETHKLKFRASSLKRKRLNPAKLAVMYGEGDSMLPRIHPTDAIMFDTSDTRPADGKLYVITRDGELSVKRCDIIDGIVYFKADNPNGRHSWQKPRRWDDPVTPIDIHGRVRWFGSWED